MRDNGGWGRDRPNMVNDVMGKVKSEGEVGARTCQVPPRATRWTAMPISVVCTGR